MSIFEVGNACLAYEWSHGNVARPLIALHGLGDSATHTHMPLFAKTSLRDTSALFVDMPGFGRASAKPDYNASIENHAAAIAALMDELSLQNCPIFGHSMGANIAIMLAFTRPDLVSTLVLAEPLLDSQHSILATRIAGHTEDAYQQRGHALLVRATRQQALRGDLAAISFLPTVQSADPRCMYQSAQSLVAQREPDFVEMTEHLIQPVTLILGERSGGQLRNTLPKNCAQILLPNAGHSMHVEEPNATACAILKSVQIRRFS